MKRWILSLLLILLIEDDLSSQSQQKKDSLSMQSWDLLESWLGELNPEGEESQLLDYFYQLKEHPINLRSATVGDLLQIPGVTPIIALNILEKRTEGRVLHVEDLLSVDGISPELFSIINQCLTLDNEGMEVRYNGSYRVRWIRDMQERRGFTEHKYLGSPDKLYQRLNLQYNIWNSGSEYSSQGPLAAISMGLLTEKDAGELQLADHYSGYIQVHLPQYLTRLILGDFVLFTGQGLVFSGSSIRGKSGDVMMTSRTLESGMHSSLSSNENALFRGVGTELQGDGWSLLGFYSKRDINASLNENDQITSLNTTGLFRTESELRDKRSAEARTFGIRSVLIPVEELRIGIAAQRHSFSKVVQQRSLFAFNGNETSNMSLDLLYTLHSFSIAAEVARDQSASTALTLGLQSMPRKGVEFLFHVRSYPKEFQSLLGGAMGEHGDDVRNEFGLYLGGKLSTVDWFSLSGYFDHYSFRWKTTSSVMPSQGKEYRFVLELKPITNLRIQLNYRNKRSEDFSVASQSESGLGNSWMETIKQNLRVNLQWMVTPAIRWGSRLEILRIGSSASLEKGYLLYQDIHSIILRWLHMENRVIFFHTDSYNSRVYEYEHDLVGVFANPALYGRGMRWYCTIDAEVTSSIGFSVKYSELLKDGARSIGSGLGEIQGDRDNRFSMQLDIRF
ncbi:MAG: helix-hairpin-helix domain-containing protein [bacterium]